MIICVGSVRPRPLRSLFAAYLPISTLSSARDGRRDAPPPSGMPDVKYFGYVGDPRDGIGYIDLSGFANDAGREVRFAIKALQHGSELMAMKDGDAPKPNEDGLFVHDPTKLKVSIA